MTTTSSDVVAGHGLSEGANVDDVSVMPVSVDDVERQSGSNGQRLSSTSENNFQFTCESVGAEKHSCRCSTSSRIKAITVATGLVVGTSGRRCR